MKRCLCRISVIIPMLVLYWMMGNVVNLAILPIGLYLSYSEVKFAYIAVCFAWLSCSPFRKSCCNATWTEILFNTTPVQIYLVFVFSQYHFCLSLFLFIVVIIIAIWIWLELRKKLSESNNKRRVNALYKKAFYQIMILVVSVFFFIPCCWAVFKYKCESPVVVLNEETWERIYAAEQELLTDDEQKLSQEDPYQSNMGLLLCFKKEAWKKYDNPEERITLIQKLVDFECDLLKIPRIVVDAKILDPFVLGQYNRTTNRISINIKYLMDSSIPSESVIQTVAHETHHAYVNYLIANLDFENPLLQTPYFQEVRLWRDNQEEYIDGSTGEFELYKNQPLEVAARAYAEEETKRILSYIE